MKTIVIGLDGAHWELLDPWIKEGILPNIKRIREEGTWGDLESCLPPVTAPNWKCYSTGKNPGKLGVYWWEIVDTEKEATRYPNSNDYHSAELWDYLNREGIQTAVVNMPTTFPPRRIDGCLISGGPDSEPKGFTYPKGLEKQLRRRFNYAVHPRDLNPQHNLLSADDADDELIEDYLNIIKSRFDVARWLVEEKDYDFIHLTIFLINVLQHFFWNHEYTLEGWKIIDENIGYFLENEFNILLMSDHGSTKIEWQFNINKWLDENGYLESKNSLGPIFKKLSLTRENVVRLLNRIPKGKLIQRLVPQRIKIRVPSNDGTLSRTSKERLLNWDKSLALASGQGPLYLLENGKRRREKVINQLYSDLNRLNDPEGQPIFEEIHNKDELYSGQHMDNSPDLILEPKPGYHISGNLGGDSFFCKPDKWVAENKREGLFAFWGENIKPTGRRNQSIKITDLMPTILYWLGKKVPTDIDGTVRKKIFRYETSQEVIFTKPTHKEHYSKKHKDKTISRLNDLGYI